MEFFGPGVAQLSIADRATIANMCPEYGATAAFFPVDDVSLQYLEQTGELFDLSTKVFFTSSLQTILFVYATRLSNIRTGAREVSIHYTVPEGSGHLQRLQRCVSGSRVHSGQPLTPFLFAEPRKHSMCS